MSDGPYIAPGQPKAAFHWTGRGTHSGPIDPPGFAQTGKQVEFEGADFHEYRDGRVCRLRIVFDMMDVTRQLGLTAEARLTGREGRRRRPAARGEGAGADEPLSARTKRVHQRVNSRVPGIQRGRAKPGELQAFLTRQRPQASSVPGPKSPS